MRGVQQNKYVIRLNHTNRNMQFHQLYCNPTELGLSPDSAQSQSSYFCVDNALPKVIIVKSQSEKVMKYNLLVINSIIVWLLIYALSQTLSRIATFYTNFYANEC